MYVAMSFGHLPSDSTVLQNDEKGIVVLRKRADGTFQRTIF